MVTGKKSINKPIEETNTISKNIYTVLSSFVVVLAIAAARKNLLKLFQLIQPSCYYHRSTQDAKEVVINEAAETSAPSTGNLSCTEFDGTLSSHSSNCDKSIFSPSHGTRRATVQQLKQMLPKMLLVHEQIKMLSKEQSQPQKVPDHKLKEKPPVQQLKQMLPKMLPSKEQSQPQELKEKLPGQQFKQMLQPIK